MVGSVNDLHQVGFVITLDIVDTRYVLCQVLSVVADAGYESTLSGDGEGVGPVFLSLRSRERAGLSGAR